MNLLDRLALRGHIRGRLTALQNLAKGELQPTPTRIEELADKLAAIDLGDDASAIVERANEWLLAQAAMKADGYEPEYCNAAHMDEADELILALTKALNERA